MIQSTGHGMVARHDVLVVDGQVYGRIFVPDPDSPAVEPGPLILLTICKVGYASLEHAADGYASELPVGTAVFRSKVGDPDRVVVVVGDETREYRLWEE